MGERQRNTRRLILTAAIALAVIAALSIVALRYLTLERVQEIAREGSDFSARHRLLTALALAAAQALSMAFSLPTKAVLTLLAGALLGPWIGSPVTMAGVIAGATALFFFVRRMVNHERDEKRTGLIATLEKRIRRRPILAVAGLRMVITIPYGPITIAASLAGIRYPRFVLGSLLGDAPVVVLYCMAGERLATLATTSEAVSPVTAVILAAAGIVMLVGALAPGLGKKEVR